MEIQELIKLIASVAAVICIISGIIALYKGIKADGEIDINGLIKGKVKTGSAGVVLVFFGSIILIVLIIKGHTLKASFDFLKNTYKTENHMISR